MTIVLKEVDAVCIGVGFTGSILARELTKAGLKVATTLFPIGPKLDTLEPQVQGLTATVASNPAIGAKDQAQAVVDYCNGKDPCNVVIIIGQKIYPFDNHDDDVAREIGRAHV